MTKRTMSSISIVLLIGLISSCTCQTFQYSRGWTNGKRNAPLNNLPTHNGPGFKHADVESLPPLTPLGDAIFLSTVGSGVDNSEEPSSHGYPQYLRVAVPGPVRRKMARLDYPLDVRLNILSFCILQGLPDCCFVWNYRMCVFASQCAHEDFWKEDWDIFL